MTIRYFFILFPLILLSGPFALGAPNPYVGSLNWPVELNRWPHQFGPNFGQFQDLGSRYFHAGQDILAHKGDSVVTPVFGEIQAGFYSYKDDAMGHSKKFLISLKDHLEKGTPPPWGDRFFEISVTTESGYRFEFHHLDPHNLPEGIKQKIMDGGRVQGGDVVGHVVDFETQEFGVSYDHIHYNVYDPNNQPINPMAVSKPVKDNRPPDITMIAFGGTSKCKSQPGDFFNLYSPSTSVIPSNVGHLVIQARDYLSGNKIAQAPTRVVVNFGEETSVEYDFSWGLIDKGGAPLNIRKVYQEEMCVGVPEFALPIRGSTFREFFFKVTIPEGFEGVASVHVFDFAGNEASRRFQIENKSN